MAWADYSRPLLCRGRLSCPSPYFCPLQIELLLESDLNNSLNEEIIIKKSYRDTEPLAFHVRLEVNWASPVQHVESKNGDCSFASSKTVLLMTLPPYGHKYGSQKRTTAPEFTSQQAPGSHHSLVMAVAAAGGSLTNFLHRQ